MTLNLLPSDLLNLNPTSICLFHWRERYLLSTLLHNLSIAIDHRIAADLIKTHLKK